MLFLSNPRSQQASKSFYPVGYKDKEYQKAPQEIQGVQEYMGKVQMCWSCVCDKAVAAAAERAENLSQPKGADWPRGPACSPQYQPLPCVCCLVKVFQHCPSPVRDKAM